MSGRSHLDVDDLAAVALPTLRHRVLLRLESELEGLDADSVLARTGGPMAAGELKPPVLPTQAELRSFARVASQLLAEHPTPAHSVHAP